MDGLTRYKASRVISRFHHSNAMVRGIMGPIGSGKSVGCSVEIWRRALQQQPDAKGVRRTRWAVIRNTYPELKSTTIQTWKDWIPEEICPITYGAPITAKCSGLDCGDGTTMDIEVYFLALDKPKDVKKLLSLELTGAWINEARELDKSIVDAAISRTGRFPGKSYGVPITWSGVIMDTNPMDDDHWWFNLSENVKPINWEFFRQPGALVRIVGERGIVSFVANPEAENVEHQQLGYSYWSRLAAGADPEWVNAMVCGNYGSVFDGKPVYDAVYNDSVHVSLRPLGLYRGLPITLGWDFGLTPACIVGQVAPSGQLRILREYVCEHGGIKQFATDVVIPKLTSLFPGLQTISWGDPAGVQASQADETTCIGQLGSLGIPTQPAKTNDLLPRRQAVLDRLTRTIDGQPAFILDPSCKILRKGFLGGYKFERVQISGEERYRDMPCKNRYSHPHDALQYLCLGADKIDVINTCPEPPPPPPQSLAWGGI